MPSAPLVPTPTPTPQAAAPTAPPGVIDGKVGKSDTLGRLLKKSGLSASEADEVIHALAGVLDFKTIRAGQTYRIERGADGRVRLFELVLSKLQKVRAERDAKGTLVGKSDAAETKIEVKSIGGKIDQTLYGAIKSAGESPALVDFFVDVFAYDLDFYNDTHEGDTFKVVVEKELGKGNELLRYKRILAAEYKGKAGTFRTFWFEASGGKGGYFTETGDSRGEDDAEDAAQVHARDVGLRSPADAPDSSHDAGAPRDRLRRTDGNAGVGGRGRNDHAARGGRWCRQPRHDPS